jgi:hypothetical protein
VGAAAAAIGIWMSSVLIERAEDELREPRRGLHDFLDGAPRFLRLAGRRPVELNIGRCSQGKAALEIPPINCSQSGYF